MTYADLICDGCDNYGDIICIDCKLAGWYYCYCEYCIEDHPCVADAPEEERTDPRNLAKDEESET